MDLLDQGAVFSFLKKARPHYIFIAAALVGGIHANNQYRADFIYQNSAIALNLLQGAYEAGVRSLTFLGSSCIYPGECLQPIKEEYLLTGPLEPTNEPYALAKILGVKLCENYNRQYGTHYLSLMPCNLYGAGDNYHPEKSHVLPALIRKFHQAIKNGDDSVQVWGTGRPIREFLHVDDLADACIHFMKLSISDPEFQDSMFRSGRSVGHVNIGSGHEISISEWATLVGDVLCYRGRIEYDDTLPDGTRRKLLDSSLAYSHGWTPKIPLRDGISLAYSDYLSQEAVG